MTRGSFVTPHIHAPRGPVPCQCCPGTLADDPRVIPLVRGTGAGPVRTNLTQRGPRGRDQHSNAEISGEIWSRP